MPHECSPFACLAWETGQLVESVRHHAIVVRTRSSVRTRIAFPPAFWTSVRGMTSMASATALNGHPSTPWMLRALTWRPTLMAISVAPPPGANIGLKKTFRATDMASARLRSISFRMSFEGPRRRIVHAFGVLHSVRNVKYLSKEGAMRFSEHMRDGCVQTYSSPIFSMLKSPHFVPTSDSRRSSTRFTMVAPTARAMRLLSDLRTRRSADTLALYKKCCA